MAPIPEQAPPRTGVRAQRYGYATNSPSSSPYGSTAGDQLVVLHAPLVRRLALQLISRLPASVELDDLIQAGMLGLLDAVTRYQAMPQAQFETYASQRIRGAMLDELRANDWVPRGLREKARRIERAVRTLEQRLSRAPTELEIAKELELSLSDYQEMLQEAHGAQLLYTEDLGEEADTVQAATEDSPSRHTADPLTALLEGDLRATLVSAIERLPDREKLLLSLYYEQGLNLKEIGAVLGVGEARVCQLRTQAISRLRARMGDRDG